MRKYAFKEGSLCENARTMKETEKKKNKQRITDSEQLRQRIAELERSNAEVKGVEEALRESEEKYRALINGMNDTAWVIDLNGNFIDVNDAAVEVLGYSREELLVMKPQDIDTNLDPKKISDLVKRMPKDKLQLFETIHTSKEGKNIPVEIKSTLMTYRGQQAILCIARDISERKQAEESLRASEEELEAIFNDVRDGIVVLDMTGKIIKINKRITETTGYTEKDIVGKRFNLLKMFTPQSIAKMLFRFSKSLAGIEILPYEVEGFTKNGEKRIAEVSGSLLKKREKAVGVVTVMRDITERKRAEEALRESEEELEAIFNNVRIGIAVFDKTGKILRVNKRLLDAGGYTEEEIIGKRFKLLKMFPPNSMVKMLTNFAKLIAGKKIPPFDVEVYTKEGEKLTTELHGSLLRKKGKVAGMLGVMRDVTERKQADERLKESFEKLRKSLESTVSALVSALEMRDPYTAGHQQRVADLACAIAEEMGLPEEQINGIRMAGLVHDIGKINIPAEILNKPGQLTEIEYSLFKNHPEVGHDVLKTVEFPWPVARIVLQHHERMDGSGYPQGLSGEDIMLEARILAVADIVEAIASHRPYRPARGIGDALEEVLRNKGTLYDPEVVDACMKVFYEKGFQFEKVTQATAISKIH
jgi:PAS domain S-box-containing protein/putative nucleotidyltransferase with HDIG domain